MEIIFKFISVSIAIIGIPLIVKTLIDFGKKLKTLDDIETDLKNNIRPDLKDIRERFFALEGRASNLLKSFSPISLTQQGEHALLKSGLKDYLENNKQKLLQSCLDEKEIKNPYDIQSAVFNFFDKHEFPEETDNTLKESAYNLGISMEILRRVGAIYFRKYCLEKHGYKEEDLDKTNNK